MKSHGSLTFIPWVIFLCITCTDAACTFPTNWQGGDTWYSSNGGSLVFNSSHLDAFTVYTFGSKLFTCDLQDGNKYISKSEMFYRFGLPLEAWLCMDITEQSSNKYTYYQPTSELADAGNIRMKIYLQGKVITNSSEVCDVSDYTDIPYYLLVKSGTIDTEKVTCPSDLQGYFEYSYDTGSGDACSASNTSLDVCSDTTKLTFNYTYCSQTMAYSSGGEVNCVYTSTSGNYTYVNVYNLDTTTDESTTYRFTCYSIYNDGTIVYATEYPQNCLANQNATVIASPGATIQFNVSTSCATTTTTTASPLVSSAMSVGLIIGLILVLLFIIILVIVLYICFYIKKKEKERRQKEKEAEEARLRALEEGLIDGKLPDDVIPNMNLGLPDESKYDLERLMLPEIITPSYVRPEVDKEKRPRAELDFPDGHALIGDEYFEEMEMQEMVDAKDFMEKRRRNQEMDEFEVGSSRASSAVKRLKSMEREKKKRRRRKRKRRNRKRKGKGGFESDTSVDMSESEADGEDTPASEREERERMQMNIYLDKIGETDEFSDFDPSRTPTAERKTRFRDDSGFDDSTDDFKKPKKKKKKKKRKSKGGTAGGESKRSARKGSFGIKWDAPFARKSRKIDPVKKLEDLPVFREDPKYKDLPTLQRIHRKRNPSLWSDLFGNLQEMSQEDQSKFRKKMNESWWKKLLGELYTDKKYFDYVRASSKNEGFEDPSNGTANEGLDYLYDRACFWESQKPIPPRPTTYGSFQQGRLSPRAHRRVPVESIIPRTPMTQVQRDDLKDDKKDALRRETTM